MQTIRYETPVSAWTFLPRPWVFLAGPTVRGHQVHLQPSWRFGAVELFQKKNFEGTLILPEFSDIHASDKDRDDLPLWEYEGLALSDIILFWIPRTRELIGLTTNFELGYWMRHRDKIIYGRPDDAYRIRYLDILWQRDYEDYCNREPVFSLGADPNIYNTLEKTVDATLRICQQRRQ